MVDPRIIDISLDEQTIIWCNADVEQERRIAIFDLLEEKHFAPQPEHADGYKGSYKLSLRVDEGRLAIGIARQKGKDRKSTRLHTRSLPGALSISVDLCPGALVVERTNGRSAHHRYFARRADHHLAQC